jgi:hypothetical protein
MIEIEMPDSKALEDARQTFAALSHGRALLDDASVFAGEAPAISAPRLHAHATAPLPPSDGELEAALLRNLSLRRAYRGFVAAGAVYRLGEVIAASTDQIPPRRGVGCRISVEASQAEADQFIVILELDGGAAGTAPAVLVLCDGDDHCHRFPLPSPHRGVIQFILRADDAILPLLRDPGTEALLR